MNPTQVVCLGLAVAVVTLWATAPLYALIPAVLMVTFGLLLDDKDGET